MILEPLILSSLALLFYAWAGYPLLLRWLVQKAQRPRQTTNEKGPLPDWRVAVMVAAYNEQAHIAHRIQNLLAGRGELSEGSQYSVWVGIDGAADRTASIAEDLARRYPLVRVVSFPHRRGKTAVLKDLVRLSAETTAPPVTSTPQPMATEDAPQRQSGPSHTALATDLRPGVPSKDPCGLPQEDRDILVFTDANTTFRPGALARLLAPLRDPSVGGVCGRLILKPPPSQGIETAQAPSRVATRSMPSGEGRVTNRLMAASSTRSHPEETYWDWESRLKADESQFDSCLGANGAIYAIRRRLFWSEIPDNTLVDDFVIGMKVREQGYRMLFEPHAIAEEELPPLEHEWARRVRIGAGDYQSLILCRPCLRPRYGKFAWMFWSHKVLRWFTPHLLLFALGASGTRVATALYRGLDVPVVGVAWLTAAGFVCLSAAIAAVHDRLRPGTKGHRSHLLALCLHFLTMQAALAVGFFQFARGKLEGTWSRTPRDVPPSGTV